MTRVAATALYVTLLKLHPRTFRRQFQAEMLRTFTEAYEEFGPELLLCDALGSLLRQRLLRRPRPEMEVVPTVSGGTVGLLSGVYPLVGPYEFLLTKLLLASLLTSILFQIIRPM